MMYLRHPALCALCLALLLPACSSDDEAKKDTPLIVKPPPITETRDESGRLIRRYDHNGDGKADIIKYLEDRPDPDDASKTVQRLSRMELDLNSDGKLNVVREYDVAGRLLSETSDTDLDGRMDVIGRYDKGELVAKEILDPANQQVVAWRFYASGNLLRVERDTDADGKIDYWEYYENGLLDRIGRDFNKNGRADSWQRR